MRGKRTGAPDYDDPSFWDAKFATGQDVGEWLNPGEVLLDSLIAFLEKHATPKVIHLGPGVSKLGTRVRDAFVARDWKGNNIVNVDFSSEAVRLGRDIERTRDPSQAMHWLRIDLRSWMDVSQLLPFAPFDAILDKSTSDAIATSNPVTLRTSDVSAACPALRDILTSGEEITLSPVELLALHLVPLSRKGSTWFVLSYSTMRFDNLPHLSPYWEIVSRHPLEAPRGQTASGAYTPLVYHWVYILQRR
ncbi:hypothetical protein BDV12DRAFT_34057 [Aspergillus spectabilis]